jgi:hypothetical protein
MRVSGLIRLRNHFEYVTHHLASRQSSGRGHDVMYIFRRYGRVSEGQQRHRQQVVLRRLEKEKN